MLLKQLFPFNFSISKRIFTSLCIFSGFFVFFYFHYLYKLNFVSVSTCFYVYQSLTGNQNSFGLLKNYKFEGYTYEIIWKTKLGGKKTERNFLHFSNITWSNTTKPFIVDLIRKKCWSFYLIFISKNEWHFYQLENLVHVAFEWSAWSINQKKIPKFYFNLLFWQHRLIKIMLKFLYNWRKFFEKKTPAFFNSTKAKNIYKFNLTIS